MGSVDSETELPVSEEVDAEMDSLLEKLEAEHGVDLSEGEETPEGETQDTEASTEETPDAESTEAPQTSTPDTALVGRAKSTAAKMGLPEKVVEALDETELRSFLSANEKAAPKAEPEPPKVDLPEALRDAIGEDAAKALTESLGPIQEAVREMQQARLQDRVDSIREKLSEEFPGISDDKAFDEVLDKAKGLLNVDGYDLEGALRDASKARFYESRTSDAKYRRSSQPTAPSRRPAKNGPSQEERERNFYFELERQHDIKD